MGQKSSSSAVIAGSPQSSLGGWKAPNAGWIRVGVVGAIFVYRTVVPVWSSQSHCTTMMEHGTSPDGSYDDVTFIICDGDLCGFSGLTTCLKLADRDRNAASPAQAES
jgi:hypothetical protein